jgi:inorganic triphosphatase YgiF
VRTGRKHAAISEIELELKRGDPMSLTRLARHIAEETEASYGPVAKAERGYALGAGERAAPVFGDDIVLDPRMTDGDAFKAIALSCLRHFAANRDAVAAGDAEGVHQMRVGLRRLRAAISVFKEMLRDAESERIKRELKWLLGELGPARDLDVLIGESVEPLQRQKIDGSELAALKSDLKHRRSSGLARAKAAIASERYRVVVLDAALWISAGDWSKASAPLIAGRRERAAMDFAAEELARRNHKILKRLKQLEDLDVRRRHKLRIAIKKLHYADEFFASLFDGGAAKRRRKRHAAALKQLQSALGKLNDMQVHARMAGDFTHPKPRTTKKPQKAFAMGLISGEDHARAKALIADAGDARKKLAQLKPFWH